MLHTAQFTALHSTQPGITCWLSLQVPIRRDQLRLSHPVRVQNPNHTTLVKLIKNTIVNLGLDPTNYSGHSPRRRGCTFAFQAGVPVGTGSLLHTRGIWNHWRVQAFSNKNYGELSHTHNFGLLGVKHAFTVNYNHNLDNIMSYYNNNHYYNYYVTLLHLLCNNIIHNNLTMHLCCIINVLCQSCVLCVLCRLIV